MLDPLFESIALVLSFFYDLTRNYALAIALLTCCVMVITTPLTMKSTRSMIEMQRLQPQIRRLQAEYKDDRQKLNEEMMSFYKEHQINPLGGCLPILIQAPVFSVLFWVIRGLTNKTRFVGLQNAVADRVPGVEAQEGFRPKYLDQSSELYQALLHESKLEMPSFGIDLAISPSQALQEGFITALPYIALLLTIGGLAWFQQKQIMGRNKGAEVTPQQKMMTRIGPALYIFFVFSTPAALGVYFFVSTVWRVAQQAYITQSLYKGEDSLGAQAQRAAAEARADKAKGKGSTNGSGKGGTGKSGSRKKATSQNGSSAAKAGTANNGPAQAGAAKNKPHPRSRKKKKRK